MNNENIDILLKVTYANQSLDPNSIISHKRTSFNQVSGVLIVSWSPPNRKNAKPAKCLQEKAEGFLWLHTTHEVEREPTKPSGFSFFSFSVLSK